MDGVGTLISSTVGESWLSAFRTGIQADFGRVAVGLWLLALGSGLLLMTSHRPVASSRRTVHPTLPLPNLPRAIFEALPLLGLTLALSLLPRLLTSALGTGLQFTSRPLGQIALHAALTVWIVGPWMVVERWCTLARPGVRVLQTTLACGATLMIGLGIGLPPLTLFLIWPLVLLCAVTLSTRLPRRAPTRRRETHREPHTRVDLVEPYRESQSPMAWRDLLGLQTWWPPKPSRHEWVGLAVLWLGAPMMLGILSTRGDRTALELFVCWSLLLILPWWRPLGFGVRSLHGLRRSAALLPVGQGTLVVAATVQRVLWGAWILALAVLSAPLLQPELAASELHAVGASFALALGLGAGVLGVGAARGMLTAGLYGFVVGLAGLVVVFLATAPVVRAPWDPAVLGAFLLLVFAPTLIGLPWMLRPRMLQMG
jgi:hypothetical protein